MTGGRRDAGIAKIGDLAASAGIRRVHLLSWRDLADVEAGGSEIHAAHIARLWAEAGLEVTVRSSFAQGQPKAVRRDGYQVIRKSGRYASSSPGRSPPRSPAAWAPATRWSSTGTACRSSRPLWARGPSIVVLHHVHAEMWKMVLGDDAPPPGPGRRAPRSVGSRRSPTGAAGSSRSPGRRKDEIVERLRIRARPRPGGAARRRPPLRARRRPAPRARS